MANVYKSVLESGGVTPTPITPSNSSPVAMTANTAYEPTANGYAVESYSSVTPSNSSPVSLSSGSIYKMDGNGKAVDSIYDITPSAYSFTAFNQDDVIHAHGNGYAISTYSNITPSNSTPAELTSMGAYHSNNSGYAIHDYRGLDPSNVTPGTLTSGEFYQPNRNGYAIQSYSSPSQAQLDAGYYFSSGFVKMPSSGYAYSSQRTACKTGSVTLSTSTTTSVTLGFEPKFICVWIYKDASHMNSVIYNSSLSTSKQMNGAMNGSTTSAAYNDMPYTSTGVGRINSINSTGFVIGKANTTFGTTAYYFAIG